MVDDSKKSHNLEQLSPETKERLDKKGFVGEVNSLADQLAASVSGSYDFSVYVDTDEPTTQKLSIMINFMLETIRRTLSDLEDKNKKLLESENLLKEKVLELDDSNIKLQKATADFKNARDKALDASHSKSQFVANMSHEIRTPMNAIVGMLELLEQSELDRVQQEYASTASEAANSLLNIIDDILDFSKIEAGKLELKEADFDIVYLVESAAELLADRAREKMLSLMTYIEPNIPSRLFGDPGRIRQVLINLIDNAIKFTDQGEVLVNVSLDSDDSQKLKIRVSDSGEGFPKDRLAEIFQPFTQADYSATRQYGGTGLGLAICSRLVDMMGGIMGAEGVEGEGSCFWFSIPMVASNELEPQKDSRQGLEKVRLLIVDGPENSSKVLKSYAHSWNMKCDLVKSGQEALSKIASKSSPVDIAVVEFVMPNMHAFKFVEAAKQAGDLGKTKLVLIATAPDTTLVKAAYEAGFRAVVTRPVRQCRLFDCFLQVYNGALWMEPKVEINKRQATSRSSKQKLKALHSSADVLLAEDNAINQRVVTVQLKKLGLTVDTVSNGKEVVEAASNNSYRIILMDCQMPEMDGYEATGELRKLEALKGVRTPIIAVTAHAFSGDREKCLSAGMDDYLTKPITLDKLKAAINHWLPEENLESHSKSEEDSPEMILDLTELKKFCSDDEVAELVELFVISMTELLSKLNEAEDMKTFYLLAHEMKGACASIGATELARQSDALVRAAKRDDASLARQLAQKLEADFKQMKEKLGEQLSDANK